MTQPTNGQLRSIIERILRLKSEQDAIGEDVKEVYAEAKSNGFDKTRLGEVVAHIRKRDKRGAAEMAEADAIFALYLDAYDGRVAPARARVEIIEEIPPLGRGDDAPAVAAIGTPPPAVGAKAVPAPTPRPARNDDLEIPANLRRERNANDDAAVAAIMARMA